MVSLITGGAGFIGSHLAEKLLELEHEVWVLDDFSTGRYENIAHLTGMPGFRLVESSILDAETLEPLVAGCNIVYHLAAAVGMKRILSRPLESLRTNVLGTDMVLEAACRHGKKVMLASTSEVYGKSPRMPLRESDDRVLGSTTVTRWSYSIGKALDEHLALAYRQEMGLDMIILRFFNIVGPRQTGRYGMVLPTFIRQALAHEPITVHGDGEQIRTFTYVGDAVESMLRLADELLSWGEIFNIGSSNCITMNELARLVKRETGSKSEIRHIPYELVYGQDFEDVRERRPDITKLHCFTGYRPDTPLPFIVRKIVDHCGAISYSPV